MVNDILDKILGILAPFHCEDCGQVGEILCEKCFAKIAMKKYDECVICRGTIVLKEDSSSFEKVREDSREKLTKEGSSRKLERGETSKDEKNSRGNLCKKCAENSEFDAIYCLGAREGIVQKLVDDFKFKPERGAREIIAKMFDEVLSREISGDGRDKSFRDFAIVPIPTIAKNVRRRGFDQMKIVARKFAKRRKLNLCEDILLRENNATQHFAKDLVEREENARRAFAINPKYLAENREKNLRGERGAGKGDFAKFPRRIILVDDIFTTGSTVRAAAKLLRENGAREIDLVILLRQKG